MNRGFPLIKLSSDPKSTKNVFLFANTPAIQKAIESWKQLKAQENGGRGE